MTRARTLLAICALVLPISLVAAGCGGDDPSDRDPREIVELIFGGDREVTSGVVDASLSGSVTGQQAGSFTATLGGAFETGERGETELPEVDLSGSVSGEGNGESIDESARLILTDDNAYVEYEGETYEAGEEMVESFRSELESQVEEADIDDEMSFRQLCEEAIRQIDGDPSACDIDVAEDWLTNLENEGTEDIEGVETIHVSGDIDVERMLVDVAELGSSAPGFNVEGFDPAQLAPAVPEASFDLYSGVEDDVLRRIEVRLVIDPSALTGGFAVVPIERVELDFSFTLSEVNQPQTIEPPEGPITPLEDLIDGIGPGALGGGLGGPPGLGDGAPDDSAPAPDDGLGADELDDLDPEQAQEYLECIQEATQSGDPDALSACADQL